MSKGVTAVSSSFVDSIWASLRVAETEDGLLADLASLLLRHSNAESCDLLFRDGGGALELRASTAAPEFSHRVRIAKGLGLCGQVAGSGKPVTISEAAETDPRYLRYPGFEDAHCEAIAVLPLRSEKHIFGAAMFKKSVRWIVKAAELAELQGLLDQSIEAFDTFQRIYKAGAQSNRLGALSEVSRTIATSPYLDEILQLLVNLTAQQFNYTVCTVRLLDEARAQLVLRATQASDKAYQRKRAIKLGESIAGRAISQGKPVIIRDVLEEEDYIGHDLAVEQGLRSMICVPLALQDKAIGVLSCYTSEIREFPPDEVKALETLAKQAAVSIEHAKLQVRTTLMQEMHHRVKNNLQQIASLLRLQLQHSQYKSLEEAINDCLARILAISSVHDLLSREDLDHVGIRSIAESLVQHQQQSLILPDRKISFDVRGDDVHLNMNQATQVALILNELIQNAIEHGFHETVTGDIHVTVENNDGEVGLWVSNSGDPLPPNFDPTQSSSLGLQIVESLSRALNGKFKIENILGWTVSEVKFTAQSSE